LFQDERIRDQVMNALNLN